MPWCPDCNKEYDDKTKTCSDCNTQLYDSFYQSKDRLEVEKLQDFFNYSELESKISFDDISEFYILSIPGNKSEEAKRLYQAFRYVEKERESEETQEEDESSNDESQSSAYVMKEEKFNDYRATTITFLGFGVFGLIFVLLNVIEIINLLNGIFPNIVMAALFIFFLFIAVNTSQKAGKLQPEIREENRLTRHIRFWLKDNIDQEYLDNIRNDDVSDEHNYFNQTEAIKQQLLEEFGDQNPAYLDRLIEEYYNKHF